MSTRLQLTDRIVYPVPANVCFSRYAAHASSSEDDEHAAPLTRRLLVKNASDAAETFRLRAPASAQLSLLEDSPDGSPVQMERGLSHAYEIEPGAVRTFVLAFAPALDALSSDAPLDDQIVLHLHKYSVRIPVLARARTEVEPEALTGGVDNDISLLADWGGAHSASLLPAEPRRSKLSEQLLEGRGSDGARPLELTPVAGVSDADELGFYAELLGSQIRERGIDQVLAGRGMAPQEDGDADGAAHEPPERGAQPTEVVADERPATAGRPANAAEPQQRVVKIIDMPRQRIKPKPAVDGAGASAAPNAGRGASAQAADSAPAPPDALTAVAVTEAGELDFYRQVLGKGSPPPASGGGAADAGGARAQHAQPEAADARHVSKHSIRGGGGGAAAAARRAEAAGYFVVGGVLMDARGREVNPAELGLDADTLLGGGASEGSGLAAADGGKPEAQPKLAEHPSPSASSSSAPRASQGQSSQGASQMELHPRGWGVAATPELMPPRASPQTRAPKPSTVLSEQQMASNWDAVS